MEPKIPLDLVPAVLALVWPETARGRLRRVCHGWRRHLDDPGAWADARDCALVDAGIAAAAGGSVPGLEWVARVLWPAAPSGDEDDSHFFWSHTWHWICPVAPALPALEAACFAGQAAAARWLVEWFGGRPVTRAVELKEAGVMVVNDAPLLGSCRVKALMLGAAYRGKRGKRPDAVKWFCGVLGRPEGSAVAKCLAVGCDDCSRTAIDWADSALAGALGAHGRG